jgi:predicted permease
MRWIDGIRARLGLLFGRRDAESRMDEEFGFHLDMETERLAREEGLDPAEARRRAFVAFGGVERHKEALRDGRGLAWLGGLSLDFKLGFRMLVKYPGLTVVGGIAMAFAIWAGVVTFVLVGQVVHPTVPLPGGDRIVQIGNWDVAVNDVEPRATSDFLVWRDRLRSVADLGAYRDVSHNLIVGTDAGRPVRGAEVTAAAFRIAPEPPLLGRVLAPADERPGAPPVVVLGHEIWRTRFAGDPGAIGRTVRVGDTHATVVGVMRKGYAFPVSHEMWTPLQLGAAVHGPREGPAIKVFGRLAPGATLERAKAELGTIGRSRAAEHPGTHEHLQPRIAPYTQSLQAPSMLDKTLMLSIEVFAVMLLVLICSNVALLLFARAATRESELIVRSALGASRNRIVAQLFAEALVLGGVAAVVGIAAAQLALRRWGVEFLERNVGPLPFWYDVNVSPATVLYASALTLLAAAIAGVVPARKITRGLGERLKQGTAGGGVRFGGVWAAVIVAQVAATVAFPAVVFFEQRQLARFQSHDLGMAAEEYLGVRLDLDMDAGADTAAHRARFESVVERLRRSLAAEPGVRGVSFVDRLPGDYHSESWIEVDDGSGVSSATSQPLDPEVSTALVDPSYFEVMRAPILAGRGFGAADLGPDARVVIVDQGFIRRVLQGRNAVGRRVRFSPRGEWTEDESRPWYQIVGVVKELGMAHPANSRLPAGVYLPGAPGRHGSVHLVLHAHGDPLALAGRVREIAAEVEPTLRLSDLQRLDEVKKGMVWIVGMWLRVTVVLTAIALLLSLTGIYSVLAFTVSRRTREIGVRVALGAARGRVVAEIFRKPLTQVGVGVLFGFILVTAAAFAVSGHQPDGAPQSGSAGLSLAQVSLLAAYAAFMMGVCMLACVVPTRRALRVEPTEALRVE